MEPCTARLKCGHTCQVRALSCCQKFLIILSIPQLSCHSYDPRHEEYRCQKVCGKVRPGCEYGHQCTRKCYLDCGPCPERVEKIVPSCGHRQMMACGKDPRDFVCQERCGETRECGHKCAL